MTTGVDDHDKRPPKQLARQADRAATSRTRCGPEFTGLPTRTSGWYRIAVSGRTEKEALDRAAKSSTSTSRRSGSSRELGQYHLAREFVPGEPLASTAHARQFPVLKVAAGLPAITAEVGDRRGVPHRGDRRPVRSGRAMGPVVPDRRSWRSSRPGPARRHPRIGQVHADGPARPTRRPCPGCRGVSMDPSGRLQRMLRAARARAASSASVDLLGGPTGIAVPVRGGARTQPGPGPRPRPPTTEDFAERLRLAQAPPRRRAGTSPTRRCAGCLPARPRNRDERPERSCAPRSRPRPPRRVLDGRGRRDRSSRSGDDGSPGRSRGSCASASRARARPAVLPRSRPSPRATDRLAGIRPRG